MKNNVFVNIIRIFSVNHLEINSQVYLILRNVPLVMLPFLTEQLRQCEFYDQYLPFNLSRLLKDCPGFVFLHLDQRKNFRKLS